MNRQQLTNNARKNRGVKASLVFAIVCAALITLGGNTAFARDKGGFTGTSGGGFSGPGPALVTVEQAKNMKDDAHVALKGYIVQSLGDKDYLFKDDTGTITVEISNKRWEGQNVGPEDLVELHGKLDKDWSEIEVEVKRVIKQ